MSHYVPVLDTPEMQRVRENQKNFSTVSNPSQWGEVFSLYPSALLLSSFLMTVWWLLALSFVCFSCIHVNRVGPLLNVFNETFVSLFLSVASIPD